MSGLLSAADLARIRATATAGLPDTCDIHYWQRQRDNRGGDDARVALATRATGVRCLLAPLTRMVQGAEAGGIYGQRGPGVVSLDSSATYWWLLLPYGTPLVVGDHAALTAGPGAGQRYEVIEVDDALGYATVLSARVVRAGVTNAETE